MRRSALTTVAVLGGLVCLLGGTVLFSALQDTARTGTNSAESAAFGASADIQLATATRSGETITCGAFSENLSSGLVSAAGISPGFASEDYYCIKNVGAQQVTLSGLVEELTDVDFACTGDEVEAGDTTCGGDQLGELSTYVYVFYITKDCAAAHLGGGPGERLEPNRTTPVSFGTLAAGATGCYGVRISYPESTPSASVQKAQSDRATWRFKFTAQA